MYTSDGKIWEKQAVKQLGWVLFFGLLGAVYERFSHEVYSYYMIYGFAVPLVLGVLPYGLLALGEHRLPGEMALRFWNCGIITLTLGCIFRGVLDIYGTTNRLLIVYPAAGALLLAAGIVCAIAYEKNRGRET